MKNKWVGFVAARYVSRDRKKSPAAIFSVLGIATGVLALIVIIAVMNGFQMGFIENILEISSGHLRIDNFPADDVSGTIEGAGLAEKIRSLPGIVSALPFRETSVLVRGRGINPRGALLRGLPPDALSLDPGLAAQLEITAGTFDLSSANNIVLGSELARHLSVRPGDSVSLIAISGGGLAAADDENIYYMVAGVFSSGFYEYDMGWAFINIGRAAELAGSEERPVLGIKLKNRWQDERAAEAVRRVLAENPNALPEGGAEVTSWRDYNRSFFGALRTEKLMMFILVGLIFIVVGLNIFQSQRRSVLERREEIGMLRALGASDFLVRLVFVLDGFIVGIIGAGFGLAAGLLVSYNIPAFFSFLEGAVNFFISVGNAAAGLFGLGGAGEFAVFSPAVFYLKEIPSRVVAWEVLLIFSFGLLSALLAAWFASGRVSRTSPAEVLRYE